MTSLLQLALILTAVALPGLLFRRRTAWLPRVCAGIVCAALVYAVWDRREVEPGIRPPELALVPTAAWTPATQAAVAAALGVTPTVFAPEKLDDPGARLAAARLAARRDPDLLVLHNGRFPAQDGAPATPHSAQVARLTPVLPVDPSAVRVRLAGPAVVGRPCVLDVLLGGGGPGVRGTLEIRAPDGTVALQAELVGDAVERVEWRPEAPGSHVVALSLTVQAGADRCQLRGRGVAEVTTQPPVTIVGAAAAELAAALAVQAVVVRSERILPADLDAAGTLVLLDPLPEAAQRRVRRFVEDGGGVFLVGGEGGGAVPMPDAPLGPLVPVVRLPGPPRPAAESKATGRGEAAPDVPKSKPKPDPATPSKPDGKGQAASGDTRGARLKIAEMDVHRRKIAMVLIIDRSGSMLDHVARGPAGGQLTKMDLARASALHTAAALDAGDLLAVLSFGSTATVVVPLSPVEDRAKIKARLEGLRANPRETTHVAAALDAARKMLVASNAAVKHAVIITDGAIHDTGPHYTGGLSAARRFATEKTGITLSLVQAVPLKRMELGTGTQSRLLTQVGNGLTPGETNRYYIQQESFETVPKVLSAEVRSLRSQAGRPVGNEDPGRPQETPDAPAPKQPDPTVKPVEPERPEPRAPEPQPTVLEVRAIEESVLLEPRPAAGFPGLAGILPVESREDAWTLLVAGEAGTPLLAFANRGLGRVGVFTADFLGPWGRSFAAGPGFPARLAQWVQHLAPSRAAVRGVDLVTEPAVSGAAPLPAEVARLEGLAGAAMRPLAGIVPPQPRSTVTVHRRAERDALFGVVFLLLLAVVEFVWWRRRTA